MLGTTARGQNLGVMTGAGGGLPVTGQLLPGLDFLDEILPAFLANQGLAGASVAIAKDGMLKVARGYGFAAVENEWPFLPTSPLCLASVSKVLTAQTILKLADEGQLSLSDRAYDFFPELQVLDGMSEDPRLGVITIQMLLHHSGGWNRSESGDPIQWGPRIRSAMGLDHPPTMLEMVRYMKGVPLDFMPGTAAVYSNFGYVLLGAIVMKLTQQPYAFAVQQQMLQPMGVRRMRVDIPPPNYVDGEARRYSAGRMQPLPGGVEAMIVPASAWMADAVELAWMMTAVDGSRSGSPFLSPSMLAAMVSPPPGLPLNKNGTYFGMGWDNVRPPLADTVGSGGNPIAGYEYSKEGDLPGIGTLVQRLADGINLAVLINSRIPNRVGPEKLIQPLLLPRLRSLSAWPEGDLFRQFPSDELA